MRSSWLLVVAVVLACGDDATPAGDAATDAFLDASLGVDAASDAGGGCTVAPLCSELDIVVDAEYVAANLVDSRVQLIDVRAASVYETGHLPGALLVDVGALRTTVDGIGGQVVDASTAAGVLSAAGVRDDASIIVYGDDTTTTPARLVWTLEHFGHERVAMLDGGFAAWAGETENGPSAATPSTYAIAEIDPDRRVDAEYIVERLDGSIELVDARSTGEYDAGHIPGAFSVDWTRMVAGGELIDRSDLESLYADLDPSLPVVAYCQTGSRASVSYVVLRMLGFADVRLYDGSWAEWGARPELPREP